MHRFRAFLLLAAFALLVLPGVAFAQSGIPLLDPNWHIVPDPSKIDPANCKPTDPLGVGGVIVLLQNLMNAAVALTIIVITLVIAYAGFLLILSPFNSENRSKAKATITGTAMGVIIVLAAWLGVDFLMKILYNPEATFAGRAIGPWNQVLVGGDACIKVSENQKPLFDNLNFLPGLGTAPRTNPNQPAVGGISVPRTGPGACSASTLQAAAQQGGVTLSQSDANTFACIARYESSCGTKQLNYNWGKGSSAAGAFQVLLDSNASCYENSACRAAAGVNANTSLNCSAGFSGGNPVAGSGTAQRCVNAAANLSCSIAAAVCVKQKQGFGAWTADKNSRMQQACIAGR